MFLNQAAEVGGGRGAGGGGEGRPGNVRTKFHMAPTPRGRLHYPGTLAVLAPGEFRREKLPPNSDEHNISHMKQPELLAWVGGDVSAVQRTQICHTRACSIVMHDSLHALPRALTTLHVSLLGSPIPLYTITTELSVSAFYQLSAYGVSPSSHNPGFESPLDPSWPFPLKVIEITEVHI